MNTHEKTRDQDHESYITGAYHAKTVPSFLTPLSATKTHVSESLHDVQACESGNNDCPLLASGRVEKKETWIGTDYHNSLCASRGRRKHRWYKNRKHTPAGAFHILDKLGDELVTEMRPEVSWVQLHVPLQINVKEHDSLSFAHLLPFSTLRIQALSLSLSIVHKRNQLSRTPQQIKSSNP